MVIGEGASHELGRLGGMLEGLRRSFDEERAHARAVEERTAAALKGQADDLREILVQVKRTNGRVDGLEAWRENVVDPQLADGRRVKYDAAAVRKWWQKWWGRAGLISAGVSLVAGGVLQVAAAVHGLWG